LLGGSEDMCKIPKLPINRIRKFFQVLILIDFVGFLHFNGLYQISTSLPSRAALTM